MNEDAQGPSNEIALVQAWWRMPHIMAVWTQVFLVAMAVLGQVDFGRQMVTYVVECVIATLLSLFFYTQTWQRALSQLPALFGSVLVALFMILLTPMLIETQGNFIALSAVFEHARNEFGGKYAVITFIYCFANFISAWIAARHIGDAHYAFFVTTVYPGSMSLDPIGVTLLVGFIASVMFSTLTEWHSSLVAQRIFSVGLVLGCCLLRQGLSYALINRVDADTKYHSL